MRRKFGTQTAEKRVEPERRGFDFDQHALRGIRHPACQVQFVGKAVDEGTKTNALHGSLHGDAPPLHVHLARRRDNFDKLKIVRFVHLVNVTVAGANEHMPRDRRW